MPNRWVTKALLPRFGLSVRSVGKKTAHGSQESNTYRQPHASICQVRPPRGLATAFANTGRTGIEMRSASVVYPEANSPPEPKERARIFDRVRYLVFGKISARDFGAEPIQSFADFETRRSRMIPSFSP